MSEEQNIETPRAKVAVVGIVGRTNAGKSTLVNNLVGETVSDAGSGAGSSSSSTPPASTRPWGGSARS